MARNRNISLIQSGLLPILALNFVFTLVVPGISLGGHLGGLIGGLVATFVVEQLVDAPARLAGPGRRRVRACSASIAAIVAADRRVS